jgi:hypothetical protein
MDGAASAGDAGFDAALKALDELESNGAQQADTAGQPITIAPTLGIAIADDVDPQPTFTRVAPIAVTDDLEAALNDSMAKVTVGPIEPTPAPAPAAAPVAPQIVMVPAKPERSRFLPVAAASLGVFASLLSVIGLLVASRTIASASLVVADARERQQQMMQVGALMHDLDVIRTRQLELLQREQLAAANAPLSAEQFHAAMDNFRTDFGKRGPDAAVIAAVHQGQVDTNGHINELATKLMRIEAALSGGRP